MTRVTRLTALLAGLFLAVGLSLSACGQKGPLIQPDNAKQEKEDKDPTPY